MYTSIVDTMVCPTCKNKLFLETLKTEGQEVTEGKLSCSDGHVWLIKDGVINFESEEQEIANNWSEYYKNTDYDELDRQINEATPVNQVEGYAMAKKAILGHIQSKDVKNIIDIATGRGMLLTYLAEYSTPDMNLVCVDLSHEVLKYDRLKVKKINPALQVNYIACDATNLPFPDHAFDLSISFFGIINMGDAMSQGIEDAVRVSKEGLINTGIIIKDNNPKVDEINQYLQDNNIDLAIDFAKESHCLNMHKVNGKYKVMEEKVYESTALPSRLDLLPIEGEWFGISLYHISAT